MHYLFEQTIHLKSACKKEMQEIQKKYDLLLREADNKLVWKKLDLESHYKKVYAHKLLADTLKYTNQKQTSTSMSQGMKCESLTKDNHDSVPSLHEI